MSAAPEAPDAASWQGLSRRQMLQRVLGIGGLVVVGGAFVRHVTDRHAIEFPRPSEGFTARISDMVIPATSTPGAVAAGVPDFAEFALDHTLFGGDGASLATLEKVLDRRSTAGAFIQLPPKMQLDLLTALDVETYPMPPRHGGETPLAQAAWKAVKTAIVVGYYTSEIGGSQELAYELVPGPAYRADVPLGSVPLLSNQWMENAF